MTISRLRCGWWLAALAGVSWTMLPACGNDDTGNQLPDAVAGETGDSGTGGGGKGGSAGKGGSSGTASGDGICQASCAKACTSDSSCNTSQGELCCDLGDPGKICMPAVDCPRFCEDDSTCGTSSGEACALVNLSTPNECVSAGSGFNPCDSDRDCGTGTTCCGNYNQPICLPHGQCPAACSKNSDCNTGNAESCCTTAPLMEPNLAVDGLCFGEGYEFCPKACDSSSDCNTSFGETCCNGLCSTSCPQACKESRDCTSQNARICCTSASARRPPPTRIFSEGPSCKGTAYSCVTLGTLSASYCTAELGCVPARSACTGSPYTCSYSDNFQTECVARDGCSYDKDTGFCDGTPAACSSADDATTCSANSGCIWSASGVCSGNATPCDQLPTMRCNANPGCYTSF